MASEVLGRLNPFDLQVMLREFISEDENDFYSTVFAKVFDIWKQSSALDFKSLQGLLSLGYDESLFRAITAPIRKDLHSGPIGGGNRAVELLKYSVSLAILEEYFRGGFDSKDNSLSCWVFLPPQDHLISVEDYSKITHVIDYEKLTSTGFSYYFWGIFDGVVEEHIFASFTHRAPQSTDAIPNNDKTISLSVRGYKLLLCTSGNSQPILLGNIPARDYSASSKSPQRPILISVHLKGLAITVCIDGVPILGERILFPASSFSQTSITLQILKRFQGKCFGFLTIYDGSISKAASVSQATPFGIQTREEWQMVNNIFCDLEFTFVVTPAYEGSL